MFLRKLLLVCEHAEVSIKNEVHHLISSGHAEAVTEPIKCHVCRAHSVKHEILQVLQVLVGEESGFVHDGIIAWIAAKVKGLVPLSQLAQRPGR